MDTNLVLASASPRRKELLEQIGISFTVHSADIDETPKTSEQPSIYVSRMSKSKAHAVFFQLKGTLANTKVLILASDTTVVLQGEIFGKPESKADYFRMMKSLSGEVHQVITSVHVLEVLSSDICSEKEISVVTNVQFKALSQQEIEWYWQTGEPKDKAGGYGIQGRGAMFIERIEGSYSAVVGLPLKETAELLFDLNFDTWLT